MEQARALTFSYNNGGQDIIFSPDAISGIRDSLDQVGAARAMVVCGPSILRGSDVVQRVQDALGERCAGLFSGVAPHSPVEVLDEAMAVARDLQPDALISVGGGSTHDTTKGIAILLAGGGGIHDYEIHFEPPDKVTIPNLPNEKLPIIAVPTTMGGAEFGRGGGGFTDKALGRKIIVSGQGTTLSPDTPGIFQFHAEGLELIGVAGAAHAHVHPAVAHYVQGGRFGRHVQRMVYGQ